MTLMPGAARADAVDQFPELAARQRIDAGGRLVQNQQIRIMNQRAAQAEFLPHAARQLLGRPIFKRRQARAVQQFGDSPVALVAGLPEQAAEKFDVLANAKVGIEVLAQAPAAYRRSADIPTPGASRRRCRHRAPCALPDWFWRAPAMMPRSVDFPTPSGPISPTMQSAGMLIVTPSSAVTLPYFCVRLSRTATARPGAFMARLAVLWARRPPDPREDKQPPAIRCAPTAA